MDERRVDAEHLAHPLWREDSIGRAVGDDPAAVEENEAREERRREGQVVENRKDRRAVSLVEVDEQLHDLDLVAEVEVDRRLVEEKRGRGLGDGQRDEDELPLAERELPGVSPEEMAETNAFDGRRDGGSIGWAVAPERILVREPAQPNDLLDGRRERQGRLLRHDGDPSRNGDPVQVPHRCAAKPDPPRRRLEDAGRCPEQRRLAGAVRPDEGDPLPRPDLEVDVREHRPLSIGDGQAFEADHSS
jgi:hypothetical protein